MERTSTTGYHEHRYQAYELLLKESGTVRDVYTYIDFRFYRNFQKPVKISKNEIRKALRSHNDTVTNAIKRLVETGLIRIEGDLFTIEQVIKNEQVRCSNSNKQVIKNEQVRCSKSNNFIAQDSQQKRITERPKIVKNITRYNNSDQIDLLHSELLLSDHGLSRKDFNRYVTESGLEIELIDRICRSWMDELKDGRINARNPVGVLIKHIRSGSVFVNAEYNRKRRQAERNNQVIEDRQREQSIDDQYGRYLKNNLERITEEPDYQVTVQQCESEILGSNSIIRERYYRDPEKNSNLLKTAVTVRLMQIYGIVKREDFKRHEKNQDYLF